MERRKIPLRSLLFIVSGLNVILCMFLNWLPAELNFAQLQINNLFGRINPLNFCMKLGELEDSLGAWAAVLPEEFSALKTRAVFLAACAVLTCVAYVVASLLRICQREKYVDWVSLVAAFGAISTCYLFISVVGDNFELLGVSFGDFGLISVATNSVYFIAILAAVISACSTDCLGDLIAGVISACISGVARFVFAVFQWVELLAGNMGLVVSDVAGAIAGIYAGRWILLSMGSVLVAVIIGLAVAGMVAGTCMHVVRATVRDNKEDIAS